MSIVLQSLSVRDLNGVLDALREWQYDGVAMQLHPGDLGWHWRFGAEETSAALRTWSINDVVVAVALLDSPGLLRLAIAPEMWRDEALARQMMEDVSEPERGLLERGRASIEVRCDGAFKALLRENRWEPDESWTPLRRDLSEHVEDCGVRIDVVGRDRVSERVALQRAAFTNSTFSEERWHVMAAGAAYDDARCLIAYGEENTAVATATVWSAGPGKPGLLEPVGVHREHRGRGYGRAISVGAAATLQSLGSSSAVVCTQSANAAAVATYRSAGFEQLPDVEDLLRSA